MYKKRQSLLLTDNLAFLWVSFWNTPGDRLTNTYKSSSGTSCSVPRDRLRGDIKALPWHSFQRNYQGTSYIKTDEPSHGTQSWNHETDYIKLELNRTVFLTRSPFCSVLVLCSLSHGSMIGCHGKARLSLCSLSLGNFSERSAKGGL